MSAIRDFLFGVQAPIKMLIGFTLFIVGTLLMEKLRSVYNKRAEFLASEACRWVQNGRKDIKRLYKLDRLAPILYVLESVVLGLQLLGFWLMLF